MTNHREKASSARSLFLRMAALLPILLSFVSPGAAGGPKYIAGTTYFDPSVTGKPLVWDQGQVRYFTDQGDLSPLLPNASANAFVANAFTVWSSVPTAAIVATNGGQLAEDVNGTNVNRNADGTLSIPTDIQPAATGTPVGVVYDYDGSVTSAFLGSGAGGASQCFSNAVFGGADDFGDFATIQHALVVINGQCAQQASQLIDVEYRLVRVLGTVLGLGWSQLNLNVVTAKPLPTAADFAGFPVMHYADQWSCVPITRCYAAPYTLAADDIASISRLYPVTAQNASNFPGKQKFATTTGRIHGGVWFTNAAGVASYPMQGVNVVARWIDPSTGEASHRYSISSVSGFLFTGNSGNAITGFSDALGNPFSNWGSTETSVEGFFDLAGLPFPNGATSAQYELSVEGIDPMWSAGVGPYVPNQVSLSGTSAPIIVTLTPGTDIAQDILMAGTVQPLPLWAKAATWNSPAPIAASGDWMSSLSSYGAAPYFSLAAQGNRTLSVTVIALDELGIPTEVKTQPVIGMWSAADPVGTSPPAFTTSPFNTASAGVTRLDAQVLASGNFVIGISDLRGDGRPDYTYHAHVLYGDSASRSRVGVNGGPIFLSGIGFAPGLAITMGSSQLNPFAISAGQMILNLPPKPDGVQNISISDPTTGAYSGMTGAVTYGAAPSDNVVLISKSNPPTPVGTQAANPVSVQVLASGNVLTPVGGATIVWSSTNGATLSACGGATSCSVVTDESGMTATSVTPVASGSAIITAALAPASYSPAKSVATTVSSSGSQIVNSNISVAAGASLSIPLTARVVNNGMPLSGMTVNFQIMKGVATLSAASAGTNANGYATTSLSFTNLTVNVQVSACVAPGNTQCQSFYVFPVPTSQQQLQPVSGSAQLIQTGQLFQPIVARVIDSSTPPNNVIGATVTFQSTVLRPGAETSGPSSGETESGDPGMPIILAENQANVLTDANGLASVLPSLGNFTGRLQLDITALAGTGILNYALEAVPAAYESTSAAEPASPGKTAPDPFRSLRLVDRSRQLIPAQE
jgi:hypothetical protein